jgi:hypothetical protein
MISLARPRPTPINIFAAAFLTAALLPFLHDITNLPLAETRLQADYPYFPWDRDRVIIWLSTWLTIALIPIVAVWLFAAPFARWLVAAMTLVKAPAAMFAAMVLVRGGIGNPQVLVSFGFALLGAGMLFLPASQAWFARAKEVDPAVFE